MADQPVRFLTSETEAGARLDVVLAARLGISRSRAASRLEAGGVRIDGLPARKGAVVRAGQEVVIVPEEAAAEAPPPPLPPVRYHDEHLLVVAKPAGLVVHPGHGHRSGTLVDALRAAGVPLAPGSDPDRPGIVHRLDRDTSGLLVVASTPEAHRGLVTALRHREVARHYLALVAGVPAAPRGRIEAPIGRDPRERTRFAVVADGRPAVSRYRVLATGRAPAGPAGGGGGGDPVGLLAVSLETGRTHQIRVHLARIGHPVLGDRVYARGDAGRVATVLGLDRPFLHAAVLRFRHPVTGVEVACSEPLPGALLRVLVAVGVDPGVADPGHLDAPAPG